MPCELTGSIVRYGITNDGPTRDALGEPRQPDRI